VDVPDYGQCWRPTAVVYDPSWTPYCDRGHWVYTDYGWYWDSDYAWGLTFHYGRWFFSPMFGWCWYPDTVWAPSWVIWRTDAQYCGWAPLPPFAVFRPNGGFFYRGVSVGTSYDFGLAANSFVFVPTGHFNDRHPGAYRVPPQNAAPIFARSTVINNFSVNNKTIVNRGFGAEPVATATRRAVEPVRVSALPNAGQQGWRGEGFQRTLRPTAGNYSSFQNSRYPGQNFPYSGGNLVQPQQRQGNPYSEPGRLGTPSLGSPRLGSPNPWPQNRDGEMPGNEGMQQRGMVQSPERPVQAQPPRNYSPPPPQPQPAPRNEGSGNNIGSNKQQNH
jgi:hypothetical protein